jgi:NAD(P)-dependent dehydrogenase (short-subunit alcohol dehydrogenase family)|tara:strand:+ start:190 stop:1023 length:834 start_codon:yes stop_codon:yes gene_type:complete
MAKGDTRVAIITGGAGGIGTAMARRMLVDGHRLALLDIDGDAAARVADTLNHEVGSNSVLGVAGDVSDPGQCDQAVSTVSDAFGQVDILVNNAGFGACHIRPDGEKNLLTLEELTPEVWGQFFATNINGALHMIRAVLPGMKARGWGRIINVTTSFFTMLRSMPYGATKAALEAGSAAWAKELDGTGVTVNVVVPGGPTDTPFLKPESEMDPAKMLKPEVMGPPIAWLSSDAASNVTGQRFIGGLWDPAKPEAEAIAAAGSAAGWPDLAAATVIWPD